MQITLNRPHLSLVDLPPTQLPSFTLLTGVNGAGKSHLLAALQNGAAAADVAPNPTTDIRLFDWTNLAPPDEGDFDPSVLKQERLQVYNQFDNLMRQPWGQQQISTQAYGLGIRGVRLNDMDWLSRASAADLAAELNLDAEKASNIRTALDSHFQSLSHNLLANLGGPQQEIFRDVALSTGRHLAALRYDDFARMTKPIWGGVGLFQ